MALLNYYFYTTPDHYTRRDMLYHVVRDTMDPASNARIDKIWQLLRRKITMPFIVCCTGVATKPYQPYSEERKAKLRATLERNKVAKREAELRKTYPLLADTLIEAEKATPYAGRKDRRSRYHRVKDKYQQAMKLNTESHEDRN